MSQKVPRPWAPVWDVAVQGQRPSQVLSVRHLGEEGRGCSWHPWAAWGLGSGSWACFRPCLPLRTIISACCQDKAEMSEMHTRKGPRLEQM